MKEEQIRIELEHSKVSLKLKVKAEIIKLLSTVPGRVPTCDKDTANALFRYKNEVSKQISVFKDEDINTEDLIVSLFFVLNLCTDYEPIQTVLSRVLDDLHILKHRVEYVIALFKIITGVFRSKDDAELYIKSGKGITIYRYSWLDSDQLELLKNKELLPPMVSRPLTIKTNNETGLLTCKRSLYSSKARFVTLENNPAIFQTIDLLQQTPLYILPMAIPKSPNIELTDPYQKRADKKFIKDNIELTSQYSNKVTYFLWYLDLRGRMYDHNYLIHLQGSPHERSQIAFARKLPFNKAKASILELSTLKEHKTIKQYIEDYKSSSEPVMKAYCDNIHPHSVIPPFKLIGLDAKSSVIQLMVVLSGDKFGCRYVGLTKTGANIYKEINNWLKLLFGYIEPIKKTKKMVMTHFYNSKKAQMLNYEEKYDAFENNLALLLPGPTRLQKEINAVFDPKKSVHEWLLPDGFRAYSVGVNTETKVIKHDIPGFKNFRYKRKVLTEGEGRLSLVPDIIHSIDAYVAREMVRKCREVGIEVLPIHDNFLFIPCYARYITVCYTQIIASIADMNIINNIIIQLGGKGYVKDSPTLNSKFVKKNAYNLLG